MNNRTSPLVSVIIPAYNASLYIRRCVLSVLNQTHKNLEVIILDDGSSDDTLAICRDIKESDDRVAVYSHANQGVSFTRNKGIQKSGGQFVCFVDSDDWLEYDALEQLVEIANKEGVECVRGMYFTDALNQESKRHSLSIKEGIYYATDRSYLLKAFLTGLEKCYAPLLLIRHEVLESVRFSVDLRIMEDAEFYVGIICNIEKMYISDIVTYHYYQNDDGATKSFKKYEKNIYSTLSAHAAIMELIKSRSLSSDIEHDIDRTHLSIANSYIFHTLKSDRSKIQHVSDSLSSEVRYSSMIHFPKSLQNIYDFLLANSITMHLHLLTRLLIWFKRTVLLIKKNRA